MRRFGIVSIFVLLAISVVWISGCRDDLLVPFPPSLEGDYTGTFELLRINGIDTIDDTTNNVAVRFTNTTYNIKIVVDDSLLYFCSSSGEYALQNGVEFKEEEDNLEQKVCTPKDNLRGFFGLDQSNLDGVVVMKQDQPDEDGNRVIKTLTIEPKETNP